MNCQSWNRRSFLNASLVGAFLLFSKSAYPYEGIIEKLPGSACVERSEKRLVEGRLSLYNTHTEERMDVLYRDRKGEYDHKALDALDYFFRCHYTQNVAVMDIHVIEYLNAIDKRLGGGHEIHIISGYRSPEYNEFLINQGRDVARHSLHIAGKAIDVRIPHIALDTLKATALSLGYGGVGYYPMAGFVHIDSGRFRSW